MKKRLVSIILTVFLVLSMMPFAAFADNAIVCPACGGEVIKKPYHLVGNYWDFYKCNTCGKWAYLSGVAGLKLLSAGDQAIINAADANAILNFSFNNGHLIPAEKAPSGIGRKDLPGYADDNGKASISKTGMQAITLKPVFRYRTRTGNPLVESGEFSGLTFDGKKDATSSYSVQVSANRLDVKNTSDSSIYMGRFYVSYEYTFPDYGTVYFDTDDITWKVYGAAQITDGDLSDVKSWNSGFAYIDLTDKTNGYRSVEPNSYKFWKAFTVYDSGWDLSAGRTGRAVFSDAIIYFKAAKSPIINKTNITINNNTWNGNIYTDNSTNLTYIYPQYTTVNEKNETVTNISNNPIIYNNETKKYYTYDTITNNYYYINYETPAPTPTPSPSPAPDTKPSFQSGGGSTRGGGVSRHHGGDGTSEQDWYKSYYVLNDYDYDCYYGNFSIGDGNTSPYSKSVYRVSTASIPVADGIYKVTVPNNVQWRAWRWDENAKKAVAVNSETWKSTMYYNFYTTEELIFEFRKVDGSAIHTNDIVLRLDNAKIVEYEPGGKKHDDTTLPVVPETQNQIVPKMSSNTMTDAHGTWVVSGSSKYSDVFDFFRAFDRSTSEIWETNVSPSYLQVEIPDPENYYIHGYIMRVSKFDNRYPKDWTLQGSNDGSTWYDLDFQTNQNLSDKVEHQYSLVLDKAYKYYRLNMSNYASSMCSLSHFNLLGYQTKDVVIPSPTPAPTDPPTPTTPPSPGGDKPGGSGSGSGSGDNSWNPFKWLTDLLKDLIEDILKGLWKLLTSIFGFILWLLSLLFKLFPWMPNSGILALCAGVVVVTVIRIIKFITGR